MKQDTRKPDFIVSIVCTINRLKSVIVGSQRLWREPILAARLSAHVVTVRNAVVVIEPVARRHEFGLIATVPFSH